VERFTLRLSFNPWDLPAVLRRGTAQLRLGKYSEAVADYALALTFIPPGQEEALAGVQAIELAMDLNRCAWKCATDPASPHERRQALVLAQRAVQLAPDLYELRTTLGVVCYRLGKIREALHQMEPDWIASEEKVIPLRNFFLAMCHQRLGDPAKARNYYDRGVIWLHEAGWLSLAHVKELQDVRREAAQILQINGK
jgi:tetratricopeptide (TPR) repeat protein